MLPGFRPDGGVAGFYHTVDAVEHLLLRVALRAAEPSAAGDTPADAAAGVRADVEADLAWQQKVFGPREVLRYAAAAAAERAGGGTPPGAWTPLEREYIDEVGARVAAGESPLHAFGPCAVFTYTDRDLCAPPPAGGWGAAVLAALGPPPDAPTRHARRERPVRTMVVAAAVGIDTARLRAGDADAPMTEVPLAVVRVYADAAQPHAGGGRAAPLLVEARPGFSQPIALDAGLSRAATAAGLGPAHSFGSGRFGGTLALRAPPAGAHDTGAAARPAAPVVVEVHTFAAPAPRSATDDAGTLPVPHKRYEYWVTSVEADAAPDGDDGAGAGGLAVARRRGGAGASGGTAGFECYLAEVSDPQSAVLAAERRVVASRAAGVAGRHWLGPPWPSPRSLPPGRALASQPPHDAFTYTAFLELVAAAGFGGADVYVAWEVDLPRGWRAVGDGDGDDGDGGWLLAPQAAAAETAVKTGSGSGTADSAASAAVDAAPTPRAQAPAEAAAAPPAAGVSQLARPALRPWEFGRQRRGGGAATAVHVSVASADPLDVVSEAGAPSAPPRSPFSDAPPPGADGAPAPFSAADAEDGGRPDGGWDDPFASVWTARGAGGGQRRPTHVAHLGVPIELHLRWDAWRAAAGGGVVCGPAPPTLLLTVVSKDGWDRHRVVGYCALRLPLDAGCTDEVARCWAPEAPTAAAAETDFFLGGGVSLRDPRHAGVPPDVAAAAAAPRLPVGGGGGADVVLSRLGVRGRTAGEVGVRCAIIRGE